MEWVCRFFFFQAEDGIRDSSVTGVQTCALPISGLMRDYHSRREIMQTDSYFRKYRAEFPFDPWEKASDSVGRVVIHVWAGPFLLSLGLSPAGPGDCALHQAAAGELLVLRHLFSRTAWRRRVHPCGSPAGHGAASRLLSGIWAAVARQNCRDTNHR